jgi:hypothetical protein
MAEHGKVKHVAFVDSGGASRRIELRQAAADHASSALLVGGNTRRDVREPICRFLALENFFWHRRLMTGKPSLIPAESPCRDSGRAASRRRVGGREWTRASLATRSRFSRSWLLVHAGHRADRRLGGRHRRSPTGECGRSRRPSRRATAEPPPWGVATPSRRFAAQARLRQ